MKSSLTTLFATALSTGLTVGLAQAAPAGQPVTEASVVFDTAPAAVFGAKIAALTSAVQVRLVLTLASADLVGAEQFVRAVSTPGSAEYGRYLTPGQFADRFGASAADYAALAAWAQANGLQVGRASLARTTLTVSGDAVTLGRLFGTQLASFETKSGKPGYAPTIMPTLPGALIGKVSGVVGFTDTGRVPTLYRPMNERMARPSSGSGVLGGFSPSDLRSIYVVPPPLTQTVTQSVALFEQGGFPKNDIELYKQKYKLPNIPVVVKSVNGSGTGDTSPVDVECDLDIDMAMAVNAKLKQITVYEDAIDPFPVALVDALANMADDDSAKTVSISYGFDEALVASSDETAVMTVALQMAAQGQTLFVSSGDDGAYGDEPPTLNTSFPATDPYVTAVGGTTLFNFKSAYAGEEAWNLLGLGAGATGGGISTVFPIPAWQTLNGASVAVANGGSATMRNVPDVAAVGDPQTGVSIYAASEGGWTVVGGTSVSSPIWAGFNSVVDGARVGAGLPSLGFFNPLLYQLGAADAFGSRDVLDGSNGNAGIYGIPGYNAGTGYDDTTGFGSINLGRYVYSVLVEAHASGVKPGAARDVAVTPTSDGVSVTWAGAAKASGYLVAVGQANGNASAENPLLTKVTTGNTVTIDGLAKGTAYYLYVYALDEAGATSSPAVFFSTKNQ